MGQDIFVGVLCVIVLAAGVLGWWMDNKGSKGEDTPIGGNTPDRKDSFNEDM